MDYYRWRLWIFLGQTKFIQENSASNSKFQITTMTDHQYAIKTSYSYLILIKN